VLLKLGFAYKKGGVMAGGKEIERKWLLGPEFRVGSIDVIRKQAIEQRYLAIDEQRKREVRMRRVGDGVIVITNKVGSGLVRGEAEIELPVGYDGIRYMWDMAAELSVAKTRLWVPPTESGRALNPSVGGVKEVVVDIYHERHAGLRVVEAELDDVDVDFTPAYAGKEVTDDPSYKNAQLALRRIC
jgi:CYTH domain-containing protein